MKVAINGFGRVGRQVLKILLEKYPEIDVVAINDITDATTNAYLFRYDSNYGKFDGTVEVRGDEMVINDKVIKILSERDPEKLPWKDMGVEYVIESSGVFRTREGASKHFKAGAKRVIITAPSKKKGDDITIVMGVNEDKYDPEKHFIISNASCTTNCLAPVVKVVHEKFGVKSGLMTTIHSYTNDQRILDLPHKDLRRARAAALNIIPTTTGAATATTLVIPELEGKIDGLAIRVPTPTVSIVDFVAEVEKETDLDGLLNAFREASDGPMKGILEVCEESLVSMDFKANEASSIVDAQFCMVKGNLVKVLAWYDNEWGYSCRVADLVKYMAKKETLSKV
ncbi:MAG: type I glyceraldehyde-3-phosphate dehydrogenase [Candidatus Eremiobacteraeota bacterium]|nr:type I glyceraldehyde-3-phosphate dehydrogenase [Candidatus Eremiobacteraeota bacterium]